MKKYEWLVKRQSKALAVFQAAKKDLDNVGAQVTIEIGKAVERKRDLQKEIDAEEAAVVYLDQQRESIAKQSDKIAALND